MESSENRTSKFKAATAKIILAANIFSDPFLSAEPTTAV